MAHLVLPDTQNRPFAKPKEPFFANTPERKNLYLCRQKIYDKTNFHNADSGAWFLFDTNANLCLWKISY